MIARFLIGCLEAIRPLLLGPAICYFSPSCTQFAREQLQQKPLLSALFLIIKRLLACNSFTI